MPRLRKFVEYTPKYQEICFVHWYNSGRPGINATFLDSLPEDEHGRRPNRDTVYLWRDELGWDVRGDELDARASKIVDDELVNARVFMLKEHAARAREMQTMGMTFLREEGFDSSASAVNAVVRGATLERESKGLSEQMVRLLKMNDKELTGEVQKLLERASVPADVIDVAEIPEDELEDKQDEDVDA